MKSYLKLISVVAVFAIVAVACGGDESTPIQTSAPPGTELTKGGTLRIGLDGDVFTGFDPQKEYYQVSFALYRCCLLRTLLSYNGKDSAHQGNLLFPDLASAEPTVSDDQLMWTFTLKKGLHYAPPMQDVEITSPDIVRAILREATPEVAAGYGVYYSVIEGFDDYSNGKADTITGLVTPDNYTLEVHLTQPTGHLGYMFAMPASAPIPPNPAKPDAVLGVAEGHDDDYGRFMVSSGPYMWEGSEALDFSLPANQQEPLAGYNPNKSWSLVRNPSWTDDDLRKAYVNAITGDISPGADPIVLDKKVQNDEFDTVFQNGVAPTIVRAFKSDPNLADQIFTNPSPGNYYFGMNLGVPPFDDIHVRRAVNFAVDKAGLQKIAGGPISGSIATHFTPDGLLTTSDGTNLMEGYDPFATPDSLGADSPEGLAAAKAEMAQSKYDTDKDGLCDAPECEGILALGGTGTTAEASHALVAQNLGAIGMELDVKELDGGTVYAKLIDPKNKIPFMLTPGWLQDWPDAFTFYYFVFYGPNILDAGNSNFTMVGATPEQMTKYGYDITDVPSMDTQIDQCITLIGDDRVKCWADADKYFMENIASIVPYTFSNTTNVVSSRVQNYTFAAFDSQMAYDQIALAPGSD